AFPPSMDVLVKGRFLRKAYKDPMTKDGKWRLVRPGESVMASAPGGTGASPKPGASPSASPAFGAPQPLGGTSIGGLAGGASLRKDESLRMFNGRTRYDQWIFLAGQPRRLGRNTGPQPGVPGALPGGNIPGGVGNPGTGGPSMGGSGNRPGTGPPN